MSHKGRSDRIRSVLLSGTLLFGSGCCTEPGGCDDLSWLGGLIGAIVGFGLFFLVTYLSAKGRL